MSIRWLVSSFICSSLFSFSFACAEDFDTGPWRDNSSQASAVENYEIDEDGTFTLKWDSPAVAYDDGFNIYHSRPSGTRYDRLGHQWSEDISFSDLEPGRHRIAVECICWEGETDSSPEKLWSMVMVEVPSATGKLIPDYKIVSIIYAPPGASGATPSQASYKDESSLGSSTSITESFSNWSSLTRTVRGTFPIFGASETTQFSYSDYESNTEVFSINKTESSSVYVHGSQAVDGISHDNDQIVLWLRPRLSFSILEDSTVWSVDNDSEADLMYVYVGHLKDPSKMPPGTANALASAGITEEEYSEILSAYPFNSENEELDTTRFKYIDTYPYQPPYHQGDTPISSTYQTTYTSSSQSDSSVKNEYTVDVTREGNANFGEYVEVILKQQNRFTWTDIDTRKSHSSEAESMTFTIRGPSYGYTGPTAINVYYDVVYKTFAFVPRSY